MNQENLQKAIALRHELHTHPELSNHETWTKARLMDFLRQNTSRLEIIDKGSWFYAAYRAGGDCKGVAFRADFDAVPVADELDVPYVSAFPGVGHKCGHDGHSASLAALAMEIDQQGADKNVFFLFQHAEETGDGAKVCTELFQDEHVDEIFGYHNRPGIPLGMVQVLDGTVYCGSEGVILDFQGTPSHACMPELGRNPAFAISDIIQKLGQLQDPAQYRGIALATIIQVDVGERAFGTQASRGKLLLTIRSEHEEDLKKLQDALEQLAGGRPIWKIVADPSAASFIEVLRRKGWRVEKADNDVLAGIRTTAGLLKAGKLVICEECRDAIREFSLYCWDEKAVGDRVKKVHDHAMDDIRYFAATVAAGERGYFGGLCVERGRF